MAEYRLSAPAVSQIEEILDCSQEKFGERTAERYAVLLVKAMEDVAEHPRQKTVLWKRTVAGEVGVYTYVTVGNTFPTLLARLEIPGTISSSALDGTESLIFLDLSTSACCSTAPFVGF